MIRAGTCSWTEKTLINSGEFYPKEASTAESRLKYYASHFDTVEVDSTYYAIPDIRNVILWAQRTPKDFIFHIKAYGAMTGHGIEPKTLPRDIFNQLSEKDRSEKQIYIKDDYLLKLITKKFADNLYPLMNADKLGVIVFQFPPWFQYRSQNLDYTLKCKELMNNLPVAVEFRHGSWLTSEKVDSVVHFLRKHQLTYITADEPQYDSLATVPFLPDVTTDIAYFRFHGRNKGNWLKKGVEISKRYDYLYADGELREFTKPIRNTSKRAKTTFAMFNNCHGGSAVKNALRLRELMEELPLH
ncbi:MAG: DUF72 domain-containing protein [Proteobacteria bacterium]|nr:DUF72 domain-containing protein [Pseudomonadota bacterium]